MSTQSLPTYAEVMKAINSWPRERRLALLRHLVDTIDDDPDVKEQRRREALSNLRGLLKTSEPPPTDEDVRRLLEERRMEKYG